MADKIVQWQEKVGESSFDNLIPQTCVNATNATNAVNAILNNDDSYSGFTQDSNNVLKVGTEIISKKILLAEPDFTIDSTNNTYDVTSLGLVDGDFIQIDIDWQVSGVAYLKNKSIFGKIPFEDTLSYFSYTTSSGHGTGAVTSFCGINAYDTGTQTIIFNQSTGARKITTFSGESPTVEVITKYFKIKKIWKIIE